MNNTEAILEGNDRNFTINFEPQHPAGHGVLRLVLELESEVFGRVAHASSLPYSAKRCVMRMSLIVLCLGAFGLSSCASTKPSYQAEKETLLNDPVGLSKHIEGLSVADAGYCATVLTQAKKDNLDLGSANPLKPDVENRGIRAARFESRAEVLQTYFNAHATQDDIAANDELRRKFKRSVFISPLAGTSAGGRRLQAETAEARNSFVAKCSVAVIRAEQRYNAANKTGASL